MKSVETTDHEDTVYVGRLGVYSVDRSKDSTIWVTPSINGAQLRMELDTGSAVSIISKGDYQRLLPHLKLHATHVKLQTYTGEKVTPVGLLHVNIEYRGQQHHGQLYVVERGGPALFGRDWRTHISWTGRIFWQCLRNTMLTLRLS